MTFLIHKSGTGIEKSGTGIEKSGTGINRSGTGNLQRPRLLQAMLGSAILATAAIAQAGTPGILLTQTEHSIQVSMHVDQRMVVGQIQSNEPLSGLVEVNLYDVASVSASGVQTYGSGTGGSGDCASGGTQTYGSGTGGTDTYGSGTGGTDTYGSGTGGTDTYGSGTGGTDTYGSGTGGTDTYGSGTGGTDTYGSGTGGTDTYGSGTGGTDTYGSGTGWTATYGSGTGSPDSARDSDAQGCGAQLARWGQVELVIDPDATYVLVQRDTSDGPQEVLATVKPSAVSR